MAFPFYNHCCYGMKPFMKEHKPYNGSLTPADFTPKWKNSFTHAFLVTNDLSAADLVHVDFGGAVFNHAHFQKIAQISSLFDFYYKSEGIPSLMHFWLLMMWVLWIWFRQMFARPEKMDEPRTEFSSSELTVLSILWYQLKIQLSA